jgi:carbamoyl-phosphate synthase small subunit
MLLEFPDGTAFSGRAFGARRSVRGEVVFHTGMAGYVEALTDPSYRGQVLVLTYPLQGNYGVPDGPHESDRIQVQGLIVHRHAEAPSHRASVRTLGSWLAYEGVPAIEGVDTRALTRYLRQQGTLEGRLVARSDLSGGSSEDLRSAPAGIEMSGVLDVVAPRIVTEHHGGDCRILLVDTGAKENIVRCLQERGASVVRVPWDHPWEEWLDRVDGVVLTNGPGSPARLAEPRHVHRVRAAIDREVPLFGICLGHQWLAQAAGATIHKMKYGHRSHNQPVVDLTTHRAYLTTQNHGYVVEASRLDSDFMPWFVNANDGSNEGIRHGRKPIRSVQFHPEAAAGPRDTRFLFDEFLTSVGESRVERRLSHERV